MASNNETSERKVGDWPNLTEHHWYVIAISLVIIGIALGIFCLLWVFEAPDITDKKDRMGLITPIFTVYLAVVTFCTVAWRGMVTSRQADQQKRQNDAKDEENLAKLLVDGTKLVSEKDANSAQVHAGIAALNAVSSSPLGSFAVHSMDILTLVVERTYKDQEQEYVYAAARDALTAAAKAGRSSGRVVRLISTDEDDIMWPAINGCRRIFYKGGTFVQESYEALIKTEVVFFKDVSFDECRIEDSKFTFTSGCVFTGCSFQRLGRSNIMRGTFDECDFSGTEFMLKGASHSTRIGYLDKLKSGGAWFMRDNPPIGVTDQERAQYFRTID